MKPTETARRIWRHFEAIAEAADYHSLAEIAQRVERLERALAERGQAAGRST